MAQEAPSYSAPNPDPEGEEYIRVELPWKWEICNTCRGNGKHSLHLGAYTADEFDEAFGTPEEKEDYFSGAYDRSCEPCDGTGKVKVADYDRMTPEQIAAFEQDQREEAEYEALCRAERRMGA